MRQRSGLRNQRSGLQNQGSDHRRQQRDVQNQRRSLKFHRSDDPRQWSGLKFPRSRLKNHRSGRRRQRSGQKIYRSGHPQQRSSLKNHRSGHKNHRSGLPKQRLCPKNIYIHQKSAFLHPRAWRLGAGRGDQLFLATDETRILCRGATTSLSPMANVEKAKWFHDFLAPAKNVASDGTAITRLPIHPGPARLVREPENYRFLAGTLPLPAAVAATPRRRKWARRPHRALNQTHHLVGWLESAMRRRRHPRQRSRRSYAHRRFTFQPRHSGLGSVDGPQGFPVRRVTRKSSNAPRSFHFVATLTGLPCGSRTVKPSSVTRRFIRSITQSSG